MDYMTITEASKLWGILTRAITYHVVAGRISGVIKKGNMWLMPASTTRPEDMRKNNRRRPEEEAFHE